ncbi:putative membrane protein [Methylophilaceae bacterium 11]|jgi:sulfoxide reductase heme-binding subunit YedZ|uniref:sulfite oxidase heme-binding subunit YedZ n=1 Tax=Methylotenera sp. 1P/1 TaxID=1131551 RepID=UPI00036788BF|nr:protein-methionine-sulfoxide reductase heme-binding subunit MsrQ [Methylotenera sp. 1P/1]EUJ10474.1 putative membrane protein [Methylophilaceae bacterium 11]
MYAQRVFYAKCLIWVFAFIPILRLVWLGVNDDLTANPVEFVERSTGTWALVFLLLSLSMTPIRLLTKQVWQIQLRRLLGLWMFAYACLHITTYVWLDYGFVWADIAKDIIKHPYVIVGFTAYLLTIPLALTSNSAMIKRLKSKWKTLHQAVYLISILVILHFWWLVKKDVTEPFYYAAVLCILLGIRVYYKAIASKNKL